MTENSSENLRYWLDQVCEAVILAHPTGELLVSSGISPSGPYHLGHSREVLTADAIYRGLRERGRDISHIHFVDCFDALRKRYPYLPESYETEAGKPLFMIPAPDGKSKSYADQYFNEYQAATKQLGIEMKVIWAPDEYKNGTFTELIAESIEKRDQLAEILARVSGYKVSDDWQPIQILDESNDSLRSAKYIGFDKQTNLVHYLGSDDKEHSADISKGQVKLDWRFDWPARWKIWGNQVEGFGREHATKGGSYDTGKVVAEEVYGVKAPFPVPYETINLKGDTKKMSSSLGNLVSIKDVLEIIPPEIVRYFTFKSRPEKQIFFDPGQGLYNLVDEYAKTESETLAGEEPEFKRAWQIASLSGKEHVVSTVPFSHLVMSYQTAQGDSSKIMEILERTGHAEAVKTQSESIGRELEYVGRWLERYAPDNVKFSLQTDLPDFEPTQEQNSFLTSLASSLEESDFTAETIHTTIYNLATERMMKPGDTFKLLYQLFLNQTAGPRLGFFLASLEKDFVLKRLRREA